MAGRPKKNPIAEPKKVEAAPELKVEPETLIEETPKVEVEEIKPPEPEPEIPRIFPKDQKIEWLPMGDKIMEKYLELCTTESDINELLPYIYEIAKECEFITEFGVRKPTTTYALLAAKPKRLVSYDIGRYDEEVTEVENLCAEIGQNFQFVLQDILKTEIEETDLIMSDAFHSRSFVEKELKMHAHKARKYIIFHDWVSYGEVGENPYNDETSPYGAGLGIKHAIEPFLLEHQEWRKFKELDFNNGLLILKRDAHMQK